MRDVRVIQRRLMWRQAASHHFFVACMILIQSLRVYVSLLTEESQWKLRCWLRHCDCSFVEKCSLESQPRQVRFLSIKRALLLSFLVYDVIEDDMEIASRVFKKPRAFYPLIVLRHAKNWTGIEQKVNFWPWRIFWARKRATASICAIRKWLTERNLKNRTGAIDHYNRQCFLPKI